uniref:NcMCP3, putative n=1 Tax=Neospora caninum (strain Liverpool) TaxID=572307 RepID=A0A0F7U3W1_NEOCL|nr:TPA: NcMCP3, putative [Neospora caninum Liverpool]
MTQAKTVGARLMGVTAYVALAVSLETTAIGAIGSRPGLRLPYEVAGHSGPAYFPEIFDPFVQKEEPATERQPAALSPKTDPRQNQSFQLGGTTAAVSVPEPLTSRRIQPRTPQPTALASSLVSQLQQDVDDYCAKQFEQLCAKAVQRKYCTKDPVVGRYDPRARSVEEAWQCHISTENDHRERKVKCVDNCGNLMKCVGDVRSSETIKVAMPRMDDWIKRRKWTYCSRYQQAADALCNLKHHGDIARYDHHGQRWMCLDLGDVALDRISYCADNCGGPTPCAGGLLPRDLPYRSVRRVRHRDMKSAFEAIQPCRNAGDICVPSAVNPPQCLSQGQTVVLQRLVEQQRALDAACQEAMDEECRKGKQTEDCFGLWLARYDIGRIPRETTAWRCYPESRLDFTRLSKCIDGCGNRVSCRGQAAEVSPAVIDFSMLDKIAADMSYCSSYQRAGNAYCAQKHGSGWVARQNCNTYKWACFKLGNLPASVWVGCAGHCGEFVWCPSAGTGAVSDGVQDEDLENVVVAVPDPCLVGETCEPAAQEPAYCSVSRPNPLSKVIMSSVYE